jgi:Tfp pilus assembly protein PilX
MQKSVAIRDAQNDAIESTIGVSAILKIRTGAAPANCAAADSGTVLATLNLPSDWMAASSSGVKSLLGTWQDSSADASGEACHFRFYNSAGTTCHLQGVVSAPWQASKPYAVGASVHNGGSVYRCTAAGTSASSGGPSGTGGSITDGTVTWAYVQGSTEITVDNGTFVTGQQFTVNTFAITASGA